MATRYLVITPLQVGLLGFLWTMAFTGIALAAFYKGPFKVGMMIGSYVGMGWACVICSREMVRYLVITPRGGPASSAAGRWSSA